jgi:hypothetical protein
MMMFWFWSWLMVITTNDTNADDLPTTPNNDFDAVIDYDVDNYIICCPWIGWNKPLLICMGLLLM